MANTARPGRIEYAALFALLVVFANIPASAQVPVGNDDYPVTTIGAAGDYQSDADPLDASELQVLVGPIALYPDDLLAIVLPASTYPLQIVQAARFLEALETDDSLEPDESWDESVVALTNYPDVIQLLNDDIDWTWQLGEAVITQQEDVVAAVESFRDRAYAAGNLKSDEHQTINHDEGIIEIVPIEDDVIYVPYYEPERVVVRQAEPVYYYYSRPYPVYYYPYPTGYVFSANYFWGVTTAYRIGWASNLLRVQHASYWGHPYYGHHYYNHYYRRPSIAVYNNVYVNNARRHSAHRYRDGDYWRPRRHSGSRPSDYDAYYLHTRDYRDDTSSTRRTRHRGRGGRHHEREDYIVSNREQHRVSTARPSVQRARPEIRLQPRTSEGRHTTSGQRPREQYSTQHERGRDRHQTQTQHRGRGNSSHRSREDSPPRVARNTTVRPLTRPEPARRHQSSSGSQRVSSEPPRQRESRSRSGSSHHEEKSQSNNKAAKSGRKHEDRRRHDR